VAATKRILRTAAAIRDGIAAIRGLRVLGEPLLCIIAFASEEFHIYQLADEMKVKEIISLDFSSVYIEQLGLSLKYESEICPSSVVERHAKLGEFANLFKMHKISLLWRKFLVLGCFAFSLVLASDWLMLCIVSSGLCLGDALSSLWCWPLIG
jgi:hypothetical protein